MRREGRSFENAAARNFARLTLDAELICMTEVASRLMQGHHPKHEPLTGRPPTRLKLVVGRGPDIYVSRPLKDLLADVIRIWPSVQELT